MGSTNDVFTADEAKASRAMDRIQSKQPMWMDPAVSVSAHVGLLERQSEKTRRIRARELTPHELHEAANVSPIVRAYLDAWYRGEFTWEGMLTAIVLSQVRQIAGMHERLMDLEPNRLVLVPKGELESLKPGELRAYPPGFDPSFGIMSEAQARDLLALPANLAAMPPDGVLPEGKSARDVLREVVQAPLDAPATGVCPGCTAPPGAPHLDDCPEIAKRVRRDEVLPIACASCGHIWRATFEAEACPNCRLDGAPKLCGDCRTYTFVALGGELTRCLTCSKKGVSSDHATRDDGHAVDRADHPRHD